AETKVDQVFSQNPTASLDPEDRKGPLSVAVAVEAKLHDLGITPPPAPEGKKAPEEARLVVFGTPMFANNQQLAEARLNGDLFLLVLVAALGIYLYVYELPEAAREGKKAKLLGVDKDAVTGLVLAYPDRELELRKDDKGWRLVRPAEAPADDTVVGGVLSTLADAEVQKTLDQLPANLADFGLDKPTVTVKLTLKDGSQPPPLVVGKNT